MSELDKIIGYEQIKKDLEVIIDFLKNPAKYRELGAKPMKGLLLFGEPGVGKTLMSNCVIKESGRELFVCRKNDANGQFVKHIKEVFEDAKKHQPAIVLLDDLDKFANEDEYHKNAAEYVTVQTCIDEYSNDDIYVIATVNDIRNLPDSLYRSGRFDKVIEIDAPSGKDAIAICKHYLSKCKNVKDVNPDIIGRILENQSCAYLETVINQAAINCAFKGKDSIENVDILEVCVNKDDGGTYDYEATDEEKLMTAYHEAGHIVCRQLLAPGTISFANIYGRNNKVGGYVRLTEANTSAESFDGCLNRAVCSLAGKAATEIIYGDVDMGCSSDVRNTINFLTSVCERLSPYSFETSSAYYSTDDYQNNVNSMIRQQLESCYAKAKKLIIENRPFLDKIAYELVKKNYLLPQDIDSIQESLK